MGTSFKRTGHAETDDILARGEKVVDELRQIADTLAAMANRARAMDIQEAIDSVESALEYDS